MLYLWPKSLSLLAAPAQNLVVTSSQKGIYLMLGAAFFFSLTSAISKWLGRDFHIVQLVFFRNIVGVVFVVTSIWRRPIRQQGGKLGLLIFRGVVGTLSLYMLFYAIQTLGLGRASTYQYTYPIFLALLSWLLIGETLNSREWAAIFVGFTGIMFVFRPDLSISLRDNALGLGNALLTAISYLSIRQLGVVYDTRAIILSFMLSGIVMPIISMLVGTYYPMEHLDFLIGTFTWPANISQWLGFLALGLTALMGQRMLTQSFTFDKAGRVAAIGYSNILFSVLIGFLMGEAIPSFSMLTGMLLIVAGGIMVSLAKRKSAICGDLE
ncbi:DMT family transporter [Dyadobacter fanqingshengii]|uniref:DMT family transporter n=1 Tax=Dyadobacter fanqingshengii TaxID=2906443 RepID=A0A9X1P8B5_9BACT|nr:DMT family transporter [Dyadobacter fanqingshengii]MCF0038577.1 DMT family transporter [Dyadobacter fanqingshengii]USJ34590.1 DMT family transporter [Dyadobacter fanqingshengii]